MSEKKPANVSIFIYLYYIIRTNLGLSGMFLSLLILSVAINSEGSISLELAKILLVVSYVVAAISFFTALRNGG